MNHDFERAWQKCELEGMCDSRGGMEWRRVYHEWLAAGEPKDIDAFIRERANANSEGKGPAQVAAEKKKK